MSHRRKSVPAEPVTLEVTHLAHDGRGIARLNDKIIFIFGALPGETVRAKYTHSYNRFDEATTVEVIKAAPTRVVPDCAHFGVCGGCQLQHLAPLEQVAHKQALLQEQLMHHKIVPKEWLEPLVSRSTGYRQKARLGVKYVFKKEALLIGFREQKNNKITLTENCHVLDARIGFTIQELRVLIAGLQAREDIPQIEVAVGMEVALVFRHLKPLCSADKAALIAFAQAKEFSLYLQPQGPDSVHKIWPLLGSEYLSYRLSDQNLVYQFHPLDFIQVNQEMNQKMINAALALLNPGPEDSILDLFCGLGNFSLPMAQKAHHVTGVEGSAQMVLRSLHNAKQNQLQNVAFYDCDLSGDFTKAPWAQKSYAKIILDPPRCGAEEVVEKISSFKAKEILYISCNPATFVRDSAILVHQKGYSLVKVGIMDMFPHTAHVETIGLFQKEA